MSELIIKRGLAESLCIGGAMTARHVAEWINSLPPELQDAEFTTCFAGMPVTLKRIVALKSKDGTMTAICANGMGSHLPFNDSFVWLHALTS